ncbi:MAG TPA: DUF1289 domain-containing protein [Stellaceae bacterium]|nr:DUF1289 domain-containing protein [Stellaceae bacterium]
MSESPPLSPCIAVCVLDPASGYCRGCFRTIDEIAQWPALAAEEKRRILTAVTARRRQKAGGAAASPG